VSFRSPETPTANAPVPLIGGGALGLDDRATADMLARLTTPVEDDLAIQRNWRRLTSRPLSRRSRLNAVLAGAASVAVATAVAVAVGPFRLHHQQPASAIELVAASGGVFLSRPAEDWRPGTRGQGLGEGQRLRTDQSASALLLAKGVAAVLVDPESDVAFEQLAAGSVLRLGTGSIVARVSKRPPNEPFVVLTDRYSVRVVGTLFSVAQGPGDRVEVSVREGTVVIAEGSVELARVTAGMRWTSGANASVPDRTADDTARLLQSALHGNDAAGAQKQLEGLLAAASVRSNSTPAVDEVAQRTPAVRASRPSPAVAGPAIAHRTAPAPSAVAPEISEPAPEPITSAVPEARPSVVRRADPEDAYDDALALEAAGDARGAVEALTQVAERDPVHAELALYGLGRLKLRRLADPEGALADFKRYRQRYGTGALLPEVDLSIFEIEASLGRRAEAMAESDRYLTVHRDVGRTDEVRLLRGNLLRDGGDCVGALREYSLVISQAVGDDATYAIAFCQRKLGDRIAAKATLRDYLARFPAGAHRVEVHRALESAEAGF
jgi:TolA-binding protein